ncbi:MAG: 23S rRNA (adenine(2030)-N(6))-methyltransferase RlmJ [Hydrogenophilales bacterium]|nr:23S rRNA (adenine(2030)-N(6))-methyltransferase RlmJ [Hydrogenophilales bacterium]
MLSYRHAFHAGNHADILKHLILVEILDYLNQKDKPWWYVDTHAGAGAYALDSVYARKNAEFDGGIGALWQRTDLPPALKRLVERIRLLNPDGQLKLYPGSPHFAWQLARPADKLWLYELHSTDQGLLQQTFADAGKQIHIEARDGFAGLTAVLPPQPRRGLVLIDPSYELKEDYRRVVDGLQDGLKRFATGTYAVWHPLLQRPEALLLQERLRKLPTQGWLHATLSVHTPNKDGFGMHGSGIFVINPPWTLYATLKETLPYLARVLGQNGQGSYTLERQAG